MVPENTRSYSLASLSRRPATWAILAVAWAGVIAFFSHQPDLVIADSDLLDTILRKSAHLFVYAVLAILVLFSVTRFRHYALLTGLIVAVYASLDEYHQTFITGRRGSPTDVAIDMVGAAIAIVIIRWKFFPRIPTTNRDV